MGYDMNISPASLMSPSTSDSLSATNLPGLAVLTSKSVLII